MHVLITEKVGWKDKESGERFRLGMKNPPPPYTEPPVGRKNIRENSCYSRIYLLFIGPYIL